MCLLSKLSQIEFKEWLKFQPQEITAWKVMNKILDLNEEPRLTPQIFPRHQNYFARENRITGHRNFIQTNGPPYATRKRYKPYYHLWLKKPRRLSGPNKAREIIVECIVPKKFITAKGMNHAERDHEPLPTIISKGFDIRSKHWSYRKYFGEKK